MITKEMAIAKANDYFTGDILDLFIKQINMFYDFDYKCYSNYNIGDKVMLDFNCLIHGSRVSVNDLINIKEFGLISSEFLNDYKANKKKPFVVEFWKITEDISLKDFIDKYCGVTIEVKGNGGSVIKQIISSFADVEKNILNLDNYRDYIIYQNQEQRFMPNKFNKNSTMAFIVRDDDIKHKFIKNDIFDLEFNQDIVKAILPEWFYEKYMKTREFDNYETGRERAILFGVPECFIEGIVVCKDIENDLDSLNKIKSAFPNCYICNIDGEVIL